MPIDLVNVAHWPLTERGDWPALAAAAPPHLVPHVLAALQDLGVLELERLLGFNETADPVRFCLLAFVCQSPLEPGKSNINCAHAAKLGVKN